jgi:glycolate oxidase subunit GlcD
MIRAKVLRKLERVVGPQCVLVGRDAQEVYSYDASLARGKPDGAILPGSAEEVAAVVKVLSEAGVNYTPRGFGTNLSGGSVAAQGGLIICLSRMNRISDIQPERRYAVVEAGVTNLELQEALARYGFFYAPDPASQKVATFGGNVAENSGGPHCVKYGVTSNHILGMQVVFPGGELTNIGGPALDPPGYDLRGVLVGSEGTLAIVTQITVRILPLPETVATLLVIYDDAADAARSVSDIVAARITPATLEMMDAPVMRAVEESFPCGYPQDAAAVLIAEVDGPAAGLREQVERIKQICGRNGSRSVREAKDAAERELLWAGRRGAFGAVARLAPNYLVADCTVPRNKIPQALGHVARIAKSYRLDHGNVFHAGDGNLHPLLLFDSRDPDQMNRVHEAGWEIMQACVELGGTITGEHGVGMEKTKAMRMIFSDDDLEIQNSLRKAFDPDGLLNPGKMFPQFVRTEAPQALSGSLIAPGGEQVPADEKAAAEIVRQACHDSVPLLPFGGGRWRDFGNLCQRPMALLRSSRLSNVIDYDPPNQVVTVGAGMPLGELQKILAPNGQWLSVRPPLGRNSTVGGIVALGACGPERLRFGAARDLVLGLRFVSGKGCLINAGGKVIKNVAGYDMTRLLTGSAGTLGFLTQLTFRLAPLPELCTAVSAEGSLSQCAAAAAQLLRSKLEPVFVVAIPERNPEASDRSAWRLAAGFEGFGETVRWQTERGLELLEKAELGHPAAVGYHSYENPLVHYYESLVDSTFLLRADAPLDRAAALISRAESVLEGANVLLDLGCGRVLAGCARLPDGAWAGLCSAAGDSGGHAILEKAPAEFKARHDVFGTERPEWKILHRVKEALDPCNIFAPGRLPGRK